METQPQDGPRGASILLVEDMDVIRDLAVLMLEGLGFSVDTAPDGESALQRLGERPYDLILLDLLLPDFNGLDVARLTRATLGPNTNTPIVALSAWARPSDQAAAFAFGIDGFLAKPFTHAQLGEAVSRRLAPRQAVAA